MWEALSLGRFLPLFNRYAIRVMFLREKTLKSKYLKCNVKCGLTWFMSVVIFVRSEWSGDGVRLRFTRASHIWSENGHNETRQVTSVEVVVQLHIPTKSYKEVSDPSKLNTLAKRNDQRARKRRTFWQRKKKRNE